LQKSIRSLNSQASRLLYAHKFDEAFRILQALAKMDEAQAIYFLGACYEFGIGTKVDRPLAYEMYRKAADLGFSDERSTRKAIFLKLVK
jgi:TPR repeat protein